MLHDAYTSPMLETGFNDRLRVCARFTNTASLDELHQNGLHCTNLQTQAPFARWDIEQLYRQAQRFIIASARGVTEEHEMLPRPMQHGAGLLMGHHDCVTTHTPHRACRCSPEGGFGRVSSRFATYLDSVFAFDEAQFGLTPAEALAMDPQQRLLLEETLSALRCADAAPQVPSPSPQSSSILLGCGLDPR